MFNFQSLFLFLTIASFPLYLFPSGGPQVSHAFFIVFFLSFVNAFRAEFRRIPRKTKRIFNSLFVFVGIIWVVQFCYAGALQAPKMLLFPLFASFNTAYLLSVYLFTKRYAKRGSNVVFLAILAAIALVFSGYMAGVSTGGGRSTSFFNNPNQLGYFTVITTSIVLVYHTQSTLKYSHLFSMAAVLINLFLSTVSLSKAAMVATSIGVVLFLPSFKKSQLFLFGMVILVLSPIWIQKIAESEQYERALKRLQNIGLQQDDSFLARGYAKFTENPILMIVTGAGEGEYQRFHSGFEVHSTFANVFFCYGVAGFGFFLLFHYRCFRLSPYLFFIIYFPAFAYGITHNGARFSFFWLLFAVFLRIAEEQQKTDVRLIPGFISRDRHRPTGSRGQRIQPTYR